MTLHVLTHESGKKCVFDTKTQTYVIPDTENKIAIKGVLFNYFDSFQEFIESDRNTAIILFFCSKREIVKKRYKVTINTYTESIEFFNIEKTMIGWINHEHNARHPESPATGIEICYPGSAYMIYFVKEKDCLNGCRVASVKKVEAKKPSR